MHKRLRKSDLARCPYGGKIIAAASGEQGGYLLIEAGELAAIVADYRRGRTLPRPCPLATRECCGRPWVCGLSGRDVDPGVCQACRQRPA